MFKNSNIIVRDGYQIRMKRGFGMAKNSGCKEHLAKRGCGDFSLEDMYADTDSYNIYMLSYQNLSSLEKAFSNYYGSGYKIRFIRFTNWWSEKRIRRRVGVFTKESFLGVKRFPLFTEEKDGVIIEHHYSKTQSSAAREAFVEYIMNQIQKEREGSVQK